MPQIVDAATALTKVRSKQTVAIGGAGAGHAVPDRLLEALGQRFRETGQPRALTTVHPCGIGDNDRRGLNHLAHEGLIDTDFGGFWGNAPAMAELAKANKIKGYNLPQGVLSHLMRASAGGEAGLLTHVGLHTFVDPRHGGGRVNERTTEDWVQLLEVDGREQLFYRAFRVDVALIRGTTVDADGNLTTEHEVGSFSMLSIAQAAKTNGGIVIAQAKRRIPGHHAPGAVKVPGCLIDYVVLEPAQEMTFLTPHEPALVDRAAAYETEELELRDTKRAIIRRAALELRPGQFVNLGYGISDGVPIVAQQEGVTDRLTFLIEQGSIGGTPTTGLNFGAMFNPSAIIDDGYQFDFFHGGGLDVTFLGFAQVDRHGNVNSSRFGSVFTGCGGFIDISQNAKKVVFTGSFAVRSQQTYGPEGVTVTHPGTGKKFIEEVEQITFSGEYARARGQEVIYVTERAVFRLVAGGLELFELAPGVDLERDVLAMMEFRPLISPQLGTIAPAVYGEEDLLDFPAPPAV